MIDKYKLLKNEKIQFDRYEEVETDNEKMKKIMKSKLRARKSEEGNQERKKLSKIAKIAAAGLIGVIVVGTVNPALASNIPILGNVFKELNKSIRLNEYIKDDFNNIGVSSSSNGITITVDEVLYDTDSLYTSFIVKSDKPFKKTKYIKAFDDFYDGNKILYMNINNLKINGENMDGYSFESPSGKFVDDYTFICSTAFHLKSKNNYLDQDIEIDMGVEILDIENTDTNGQSAKFDGKWNFNFMAKSTKNNTVEIDIGTTKEGITLNKVIYTPLNITVDLTLPKKYLEEDDAGFSEYYYIVTNEDDTLLGYFGSSSSEYIDESNDICRYIQKYNLNGKKLNSITVGFYKAIYGEDSIKVTDFKVDLSGK